MAKSVKLTDISAAIEQELTLYHADVTKALDALSAEAVKSLVQKTKAAAPKGKRGSFKKNISSKQARKDLNGSAYVWYVKAPDYRLTHLLVHGHAKKGGGRTKSNPFLQNAVDEVLPEYQKNVEEALRNGK